MATCFCGCGERVGVFQRGLNRNGAGTLTLLDRLRDARDRAGGDLALLAELSDLVTRGESHVEVWTGIRHGQVPTRNRSRDFRAEWNEWGTSATRLLGRLAERAPAHHSFERGQ